MRFVGHLRFEVLLFACCKGMADGMKTNMETA